MNNVLRLMPAVGEERDATMPYPRDRHGNRKMPMSEEDAAVGAMLRLERLSRGMSQESVADKCGFTFQFLQKLEKGKNHLTVIRLNQIAKAVGFNPARFVGKLFSLDHNPDEAKANGETKNLIDLLNDKDAAKLLRLFAAMKPAQRRAILSVAALVAENEDGA